MEVPPEDIRTKGKHLSLTDIGLSDLPPKGRRLYYAHHRPPTPYPKTAPQYLDSPDSDENLAPRPRTRGSMFPRLILRQ